jgi:hypothetical protein
MLHPFLILPIVSAGILTKIAFIKGGLSRVLIIMVLSIIIFGLFCYVNNTIKLPRRMVINPIRLGEIDIDIDIGVDGINGGGFAGRFQDILGGLGGLGLRGGGPGELIMLMQEQIHQDPGARIVFDVIRRNEPDGYIGLRAAGQHNDVHDHDIQTSLRQGIEQLIKWYKTVDIPLTKEQTMKQIKEFIFNKYHGKYEEKENAYNAVRTVELVNGKLVSTNKTELEILMMVWQRIRDPINKDVADELKNNLLGSLSDSMVNTGRDNMYNTYCLVGRVTRIVQSLQSLDVENIVNIKSVDIIAKEIQDKIPVFIEKYFTLHADEQTAYDNGDNDIAKKLQHYVNTQLRSDYKDTDIMDKHKKLIDSYIDELL